VELNQVTLPAIDVAASIRFYRTMGFELIVEEPHYARFRSSVGDATFSVHAVGEISGPSQTVVYFECQSLDEEVVALQAKGIEFFQEPRDEPCCGAKRARVIPPATRAASTMLGRTGLPCHGE
jgi:catechol 2,3-dioxygenase-like lactoylglutathione lyase family enzyme